MLIFHIVWVTLGVSGFSCAVFGFVQMPWSLVAEGRSGADSWKRRKSSLRGRPTRSIMSDKKPLVPKVHFVGGTVAEWLVRQTQNRALVYGPWPWSFCHLETGNYNVNSDNLCYMRYTYRVNYIYKDECEIEVFVESSKNGVTGQIARLSFSSSVLNVHRPN